MGFEDSVGSWLREILAGVLGKSWGRVCEGGIESRGRVEEKEGFIGLSWRISRRRI